MRRPLNQTEQPRIDHSKIKKILLVRLRRIGDIIMTTPAAAVLRESFPHASLSYVVESPYKELVEGNRDLDRVIILPRTQSVRDFLRHIRQIRRERYDVLIDFHGGPRASLITFLSRARLKIGYRVKYRSLIYDIKIPRGTKEGYIHSVENHLNLVKTLGISASSAPPLHVPRAQEAEAEKVNKFLAQNNLYGSKVIALHIGAGNEFRNWGIENLIALAALLSQIPGAKIVLIGGPEDKKTEEEILKKSSVPLLSLVGRLNLRELRLFFSLSSLFVGPDSGPMHVAAAASTPIVAIFGPNIPALVAPWKADAIAVEKDFDCRPCDQRHCIYGDIRCLRSITPQEVYEACLKFIS